MLRRCKVKTNEKGRGQMPERYMNFHKIQIGRSYLDSAFLFEFLQSYFTF